MQGSSRKSMADATATLHRSVGGGVGASAAADELFAAAGAISTSATLRRALADPSRDAADKRALAQRLFSTRVGAQSMAVIDAVVSARWAHDRDLDDALERLAFDAKLMEAEAAGRLSQVQDEVFRFERVVASNGELTEALTRDASPLASRLALVDKLLPAGTAPETAWLLRSVVSRLRGRRFTHVVEVVLEVAQARRQELNAIVTSAVDLDITQRERLAQALTRMYGKPVFVTVVIDPDVLGGIRVRVGDEVLDGTISRRLDQARKHLLG